VKDTGEDLGVLTEDAALLVEQTMEVDGSPRTITDPQPVDWAVKNGWYLLTPVGERMNVDPRLQLGTFVIVANQPNEDYCTVGGVSWLYTVDYRSGGPVATQRDMAVGQPVGNSIATGLTLIRLPTNKLIAVVTQADTTVRAMDVPAAPGAAGEARRVGWSEVY
jgi:Tfp pilus tip-associated adhesin PilY1